MSPYEFGDLDLLVLPVFVTVTFSPEGFHARYEQGEWVAFRMDSCKVDEKKGQMGKNVKDTDVKKVQEMIHERQHRLNVGFEGEEGSRMTSGFLQADR